MDESWIPLIVVVGVVIMVVAVSAGMVGRAAVQGAARKVQARADAENTARYRELAEQCAIGQQQAAAELARLTERVAAIEKLLTDVG